MCVNVCVWVCVPPHQPDQEREASHFNIPIDPSSQRYILTSTAAQLRQIKTLLSQRRLKRQSEGSGGKTPVMNPKVCKQAWVINPHSVSAGNVGHLERVAISPTRGGGSALWRVCYISVTTGTASVHWSTNLIQIEVFQEISDGTKCGSYVHVPHTMSIRAFPHHQAKFPVFQH